MIAGWLDTIKVDQEGAPENLWVPAVNNAQTWGRWAFVEIRDPSDEQSFIRQFLADELMAERSIKNPPDISAINFSAQFPPSLSRNRHAQPAKASQTDARCLAMERTIDYFEQGTSCFWA
ncbi:MAG: hypothetical protein EA424_16755 [Planctomycetaceae bacterium]|nr:MAG: hypothetical protein EA424_16755 [Planctomycetaceae bacterium]